MTNDDNNIRYNRTVINRKLLDHNMIIFDMNMTKTISCNKRTNPYDNIVYEYDTMTEGPEWDNFIEYIDDFNYSDTDMDADVYLESMYDRINEGCKLYLQKKRQFQ